MADRKSDGGRGASGGEVSGGEVSGGEVSGGEVSGGGADRNSSGGMSRGGADRNVNGRVNDEDDARTGGMSGDGSSEPTHRERDRQ